MDGGSSHHNPDLNGRDRFLVAQRAASELMDLTYIDCSDPAHRDRAVSQAGQTARRHQLVVFPTDTVYAVACDAFSAMASTDSSRRKRGCPAQGCR